MMNRPIIEQHFHGAFGVDFNKAATDDILFVAREIKKYGVGGIFPTLVTDSIDNIKHALSEIKKAAKCEDETCAKIYGVHLEGIFLNPLKKGIHNEKLFLEPTVENFKKIEDDFIKIVTLAPEMCKNRDLINYLISKNIKVQAGHCTTSDLTDCTGVTHLFNAMEGIHHRNKSTALSALVNDDIYTEVIADGVHISDEALKLIFKCKPSDKIILVSDCLACTKSRLTEFEFAGEKIYYDGAKAYSKDGTIAGSTTLLPDIIKLLIKKEIIDEKLAGQLIENPYRYHNL